MRFFSLFEMSLTKKTTVLFEFQLTISKETMIDPGTKEGAKTRFNEQMSALTFYKSSLRAASPFQNGNLLRHNR